MADLSSIRTGQDLNQRLEAISQATEAAEVQELSAEQETSHESFVNQCEEMANPFAAKAQTSKKPVKSRFTKVQKMLQAGEKGDRLAAIQALKDSANKFQQRNPELKANVLTLLRDSIKPGDSKEEILKKLQEFYPDVSLADEALEFLLETTEGELNQQVQQAKDDLNKDNKREIIAGRNIHTQAREAAEKGLGTPTSMRDMYRDITGNPRDATSLFQELSQKYAYKELKAVIDFMLHSLGSDMKSKGPSIARGELHRLFTEVRSMQAILGVYRFFRGRMRLINSLFAQNDMEVPPELNFESMSKEFMALVSERYPSADKVNQRAVRLSIEDWLMAKIIAFSQFRDAVREVAMGHIFRSLQHRDELYMAILEALENLEDEYEDQQEREEDEEESDKNKK